MRLRFPHTGWLALIALLMGVSGTGFHYWWKYRQAQALVAAVERRGGEIGLTYDAPLWFLKWVEAKKAWKYINFLKTDVVLLHVSGASIDDAWMRRLPRLTRIKSLNLRQTRITDAGLASLKLPASLRTLDLSESEISDIGLKSLAPDTGLRHLVLTGTHITDAGLSSLRELKKLEYLDLSHTGINGSGLEVLQDLPSLNSLHLDHTKIAEEHLKHLESASAIQFSASFKGTYVTRGSVVGLRDAGYLWNEKNKLLLRIPPSVLKRSQPTGQVDKGL